jgi:uncharacterized protein YbjT (DUF2867 family)
VSVSRVLVTGATGYVGGRIIPMLLEQGYTVRAASRDASRLQTLDARVERCEADALDESSLQSALSDVDAALYLIHSMDSPESDFRERDRAAAMHFARAAKAAGVSRIIYLGGLGGDGDALSEHLRSRHEVGEILRAEFPGTIELRAAMIVGAKSASFLMTRYLTERLPLMIAPRWVNTKIQPISIDDVLAYLSATLQLDDGAENVYEIGGADILTYADTMRRYAAMRGLRRCIITVPLFTPRLSSYWVHFVTPVRASLARALIDGLYNELVVRDDAAARDFPLRPMGYEAAVARALREPE